MIGTVAAAQRARLAVIRPLREAAARIPVLARRAATSVRAVVARVFDRGARSAAMPVPATEKAARRVTGVIAALLPVASATGWWVRDLYRDPAPVIAMFRAYDLVTLLGVTPVLIWAMRAARGSTRARLVWAAMLVHVFYTYAYYVFGAAVTALFPVHVALLVGALAAVCLLAAATDVPGLPALWSDRTPVRAVSVVLGLLAASLGGMWTYFALRSALTGVPLPDGLLVQPPSLLRLGYVMDLTVLVPGYAAGAALLWRRGPWGYAGGTVLLVASVPMQVTYMAALALQSASGVPGATPFDPAEPVIATAIAAAAAAMLHGLGRAAQPGSDGWSNGTKVPAPGAPVRP